MKKILGHTKIRDRWICTIPKEVREYLDIKIGDELSLTYEHGEITIKKVKLLDEDFKIKD